MLTSRLQTALLTIACAGSLSLVAQEIRSEGPVETRATILAESKDSLPLDPALLRVEVDGHPAPLTSLTRVQPANLEVAILIDDGLRNSFGVQIGDIKDFIRTLPPQVHLFIGYMRNGGVIGGTGFTQDRAALTRALRVPLGAAGAASSPYFTLSAFVKDWPSNSPATRVVMLLTNGVDPYNGSVSITNQDSPYVQTAQEDAERAGVAVYAIAYANAGIGGGAAAFSGQGYLDQVAHATGGRSLYQGTFNPVSLKPFLNEFRKDLMQTYTARFMASSNHEKPRTLVRLKVSTAQDHVKVRAPEGVHPGER